MHLMTIAHAFNYRVAVLRDGVKSAIQVGRSRKVEGRFLTEPNISWGPTGGRDVPNIIDPGLGSASILTIHARIAG